MKEESSNKKRYEKYNFIYCMKNKCDSCRKSRECEEYEYSIKNKQIIDGNKIKR